MRVVMPFVGFVLSGFVGGAAPAQVSATLVANTPFVASWTMGAASGSASYPAGPLLVDGSMLLTAPSGNVRMQWVVPPPGSASCQFRAWRDTSGMLVYASAADLTMAVVGPVGQRGHVRIAIEGWDDIPSTSSVTIDVGNDGSIEATSTDWPFPYQREWRVPATLGAAGLDVRIVHDDASFPAGPGASWWVWVSFEPMAAAATDLGSSCATNDVGWALLNGGASFVSEDHPYFLHAAPGTGSDLCRLIARGHGPMAAFVASTDPARVAPGWLGVGHGCDDLLQDVLFTVPGQWVAAETWEFVVPALPPGLTFWFQHASFGPAWEFFVPTPTLRTGVTNLVRVDS